MYSARIKKRQERHGASKRALVAAATFFILIVAPTASAGWQAGELPPSHALFTSPQAFQDRMPDHAQAVRLAALNKAIPENPGLAVPASPFVLTDPASRLSAIDCMTAAIYYEAGNEPITGQRAVAQVVLNRMRHPAYPDSVCAVVFQGAEQRTGCQFTFTCDGSLARHPNRSSWLRAQSVAFASLSGAVEPSVGHATHYHASYVLPYWAKNLTKLREIGSHIFYQWGGRWAEARAFSDKYSGKEALPFEAQSALAEYILTAQTPEVAAIDASTPTGAEYLVALQSAPRGYDLKALLSAGRPASQVVDGSGIKPNSPQLVVSDGRLKDEVRPTLIESKGTLDPK